MRLRVLSALSVALLLGAQSCSAAAARTDAYKQSAKSALDFIAHEQAAGAAEAASTARPGGLATSTAAHTTTQSSQQHLKRPQDSTGAPKKDWELVPPHQGQAASPRPATPTPSGVPFQRPTVPTYAGVAGRDHYHHHHRHQDSLPTVTTTSSVTTQRPRVYNIPIVVEDRGNYTTTTEQSRWYDKLFGKASDVDDSPWGRRRRQVPQLESTPTGAQREEVVIGSNAIRVSKPTKPPQTRQRPGGL